MKTSAMLLAVVAVFSACVLYRANAQSAARAEGVAYTTIALFVLPQVAEDRVVLGGVCFDAPYLKQTLFPGMIEEMVKQKSTDQGGNQLAMIVYPAYMEGGNEGKPLAASPGWGEGKPEVSRKLDDVFRGLALGIKYQGTSVEALGRPLINSSPNRTPAPVPAG